MFPRWGMVVVFRKTVIQQTPPSLEFDSVPPLSLSPNHFDISHFFPVRLYGDGAEAQQPFEIYTILSVMGESDSTLDSRLLTTTRNTLSTADTARDRILEVLAWSLEACRTPLIH